VKTTDERIQAYLKNLKVALKGMDKAVIQDALADAEEHLRAALAAEMENQEGDSPEEVLEGIIADYGTPDEIAEAYRNWERSLPPALAAASSTSTDSETKSRKRYPGFFGIYADPQAWGRLVYLLISVVTGSLYFSWAVAGFFTSLGVMILIIGIPVTILFLLSIRGLAFLEGRLVEALLGERMPRRPAFTDPKLERIKRLKQLLLGKSTWLALLYMFLMLPLGVIYFSVMATLLATSAAMIASPVLHLIFDPTVVYIGPEPYSFPTQLTPLLAIGGVLLTTLSLHLANWIGWGHGKLAKALLVSE
jgi:hypothetical protein